VIDTLPVFVMVVVKATIVVLLALGGAR